MVILSRIYTKTGDGGETSLGDGSRVPKHDPRVGAYGTVDELNAVLGLLVAHHPEFFEAELVRLIQNDLFDVGADLCVPLPADGEPDTRLRVQAAQADRLERAIDRLNAPLAPLTSFVLPGGTPAAAWCHLARTVCRRAEREVAAVMQHTRLNPSVLVYLNRLSDVLFVLSRAANDAGAGGAGDVLWVPGKSRTADLTGKSSPAEPGR